MGEQKERKQIYILRVRVFLLVPLFSGLVFAKDSKKTFFAEVAAGG